ncbi:MAG: LysM peptidoglycan-binding domain-containing protein [Bacteroidales bacterium]|nr:LysM peptidoglycan-binding domain-containing protein [Bacteroidales bacterium]
MKYIFIFYFGIILFLNSFGQSNPVEVIKSTEKVIIEGRVYYIHEVKKGETLYSISLAYNVELKELIKENPDVLYGLMIGHILKIPYVEEREEGYIYHHVEKGQTIYSLTRKYNIDTTILYKYNPEVRSGLKYDMILKIPEIKTDSLLLAENEDEKYVFHKVKRKETLYSLSKRYNVNIQDIKDSNPELKYNQLKYGQTIKIPIKKEEIKKFNERAFSIFIDTSHYSSDSLIYYNAEDFNCKELEANEAKKSINIAILLPFYISENESMNMPDTNNLDIIEEKPYKIYKKSYPFLEFYEGLLLALDTLKKEGISINLYTYSIENDTNSLKEIINNLIITDVDLIIGPVHSKAIDIMVEFSNHHQVPLILPFASTNDILINNQNVFIVKPTNNTENERIAQLLSDYYDYNIVLVTHDSFFDSLKLSAFKSKFYEKISKKTNFNNVVIKEVIYNDTLQKSLEHSLSSDYKNIVFINSNNEAFVSEIITKLNGLTLFYNISVIGFPYWQWFRNIDIEYYYNLQLKYITPFYVDYDFNEIKKFLIKYREVYYTEPFSYSYAFLGYDILYYFSKAFNIYGESFPYCLSALKLNLLHSDFKFYRINSTSGFENMGGKVYHYLPGLKINKYSLSDARSQENK